MASRKSAGNFIEPIGVKDSQRYADKLTVGGKRLPDPYYAVPKEEWSSGLSEIPRVIFPDIYVYCVHKVGIYTQEQMCAFRSLEAHNYFLNGFVGEIQTKAFKFSSAETSDQEVVFMKTDVLPSQRVGKTSKPYHVWVLCHATGEVVSAHCTCMAGLDETCSHAVAVMFKAQAAVMLGLNVMASTSKACQWNRQFRRSVEAAKVKEMELTLSGRQAKRRASGTTAPMGEEKRKRIKELMVSFGKDNNCAFMTCMNTDTSPEVSALSRGSLLPCTILKICDLSRLGEGHEISPAYLEDFMEKLPKMFKEEELLELERRTSAQSASKLWCDHRQGRLTASLFGDVLTCHRSGNAGLSVINRVCEVRYLRPKGCGPDAMQWGKDKEAEALSLVVREFGAIHSDVQLHPAGLVVGRDQPYLGASPDGYLTCGCCSQRRVVEVKCPFSIRNGDPQDAPYLDLAGNLKSEHKYYSQVQGQLALTGLKECVFGVYTNKGAHITVIVYDSAFCGSMLPVLRSFYTDKVLPVMLAK